MKSTFIRNFIETRCCGGPFTFRFHVFTMDLKVMSRVPGRRDRRSTRLNQRSPVFR